MTGIVTYLGPHFSSFGLPDLADYTVGSFQEMCIVGGTTTIKPSRFWSDDRWYDSGFESEVRRAYRENANDGKSTNEFPFAFSAESYQKLPALNRKNNEGHIIIQEGMGEGVLVGGNLCSLVLLLGTRYMPRLAGSILLVEDIGWRTGNVAEIFARDLAALSQQPGFDEVRGILIGRFPSAAGVGTQQLQQVLNENRALQGRPIIANLDFGHTFPIGTFPIGGHCSVDTHAGKTTISVSC